jgi:hypothetical protein
MGNSSDRTVYRRPDGSWVNKHNDSERASSLHDTQKEAEDAARRMLHNEGGGELSTHGLDGKIRSKGGHPTKRKFMHAKDPVLKTAS